MSTAAARMLPSIMRGAAVPRLASMCATAWNDTITSQWRTSAFRVRLLGCRTGASSYPFLPVERFPARRDEATVTSELRWSVRELSGDVTGRFRQGRHRTSRSADALGSRP